MHGVNSMEKKKKHPCASIYCLMLTWIQELAPFSAQHGALHSRSTQIGDSAAPVSSFASWAKELMKRTWPTLMLQCFISIYIFWTTHRSNILFYQASEQPTQIQRLNADPWTNTLFNILQHTHQVTRQHLSNLSIQFMSTTGAPGPQGVSWTPHSTPSFANLWFDTPTSL